MEEAVERMGLPVRRELTDPEIPTLQHELNEVHEKLAAELEELQAKLASVLAPLNPEADERKALATLVRPEPVSSHGRWIEERIGHVRAMVDQVSAISTRLQL